MLTNDDIKIGQYVKNVYSANNIAECIVSINSQYAYTNCKNRIYPKNYYDYYAITPEDAKATVIHGLNNEITSLIKNINNLGITLYELEDTPYLTCGIDSSSLNDDIKDIINKASDILNNIKE